MPVALEGDTPDRRFVIVEFDNVQRAKDFYNSAIYLKAREARNGASIADIVVLEGV